MKSGHIEALEPRRLLASISGIVVDDLNGNARLESGEPGLANQTVYLDINFNGLLDPGEPNTKTDATGAYLLLVEDSPVRTARLRHLVPEGRRLSAPESIFYDVPVGGTDDSFANRNFANTSTAVIRGTVFADANGSGLRESGEKGIEGWTVFLDKNHDGIYQPGVEKVRVTNRNGDYRFAGLTPGTYYVRVVQQNGFVRTNPLNGLFKVKLTFAQGISNRNFAEQLIEKQRP